MTGRPAMPRTKLRQGHVLLLLAGQVLAVHEEEFGAQQADALGPHRERLLELARQLEIGLERDLDPVARHRGELGEPRELALLALEGAAALLVARRAWRRRG